MQKWVLGLVESVSVSDGGVIKKSVSNGYNSTNSNLETVSHFGHLEKRMTYYPDGTLNTSTDGLNHTTTFANYKLGIAQNVTYPDGTQESAVVNNIGLITSTTRPTELGNATTSYGYDGIGRLASITQPAGDTVQWNATGITYNQAAVTEFDPPAGHWRQYVTTGSSNEINYLDAMWRPVYTERWDEVDKANTYRIVKHKYDFAGRTTFDAYPKRSYGELGDSVSQQYDALGRPTVTSTSSELGALTSSFGYLAGFQKVHTDARGNSTYYRYQVFDEPSEDSITNITAPEGVSVAITRDLFGKPRSITRSGANLSASRSYVYDSSERLCKTIEPETGATVQDYDLANNVSWRATGLSLP